MIVNDLIFILGFICISLMAIVFTTEYKRLGMGKKGIFVKILMFSILFVLGVASFATILEIANGKILIIDSRTEAIGVEE